VSDAKWRTIENVDRPRLRAARLQAHYATQWLARAAYAYVPAQPDDRHSNLGWDDIRGGLVTRALPDGTQIGLRFRDLALMIFTSADPTYIFRLHGRRDADVRAWLGSAVADRGFDPAALDAPLPYQLPPSNIGSAEAYSAADDAGSLDDLARWYANANDVMEAARLSLVARNIAAPPVRCWPHHFDLDSLVQLRPGYFIGIGFEPGDDYYDEPYFYVSLYPAPDVASLPDPPAIAHWHAKGFTAAVAPATRIAEARDQKGEVEAYLEFAIDTGLKALS
jgi:hypothetical protein